MNAAALPAFEQTEPTARLIPIAHIQTEAQVRTRNGFDAESIAQLAASIATLGLLQPIVVAERKMEPNLQIHPTYRVIAGHRRLAACQLAGLKSVPAIVHADMAADRTLELQLVENIQREDLDLADTADAVRQLMTLHKSPKAVAAIVSKSASWVSKHLALTSPNLHPDIRTLLESGATDDVELLYTLHQIARIDGAEPTLRRLLEQIVTNEAGRGTARAALAKLKAKPEDDEAEDEEDDAAAGEAEAPSSMSFTLAADEWAQVEALGGAKWLRKTIRAALQRTR